MFANFLIKRECTGPPIICKPSHPIASIKIDDSVLFMVMYTDGLAKVIEQIDLKGENTDAKLAKVVIEKIINEQSLNSAAQAVLDEVNSLVLTKDYWRSSYNKSGK